MSTEVSERQALSNLIRCSRSREPIITNDSASLRSRVDVGARLAGIEHRREVSLSPTVSCWPRSGNFVKRLRSCVGMSRLLEWFLFFLATMVSSQLRGLQLCWRPTQRAQSSKVAAKLCQCFITTPGQSSSPNYNEREAKAASQFLSDLVGSTQPCHEPWLRRSSRFQHSP